MSGHPSDTGPATPEAHPSRPAGERSQIRLLAGGKGRRVRIRDGRQTGLLAALARRYSLVGVIEPTLAKPERLASLLRSFYPSREAWRARAGLHPWVFRRLSGDAVSKIADWRDNFDLVMLIQTLFSPGPPWSQGPPYAIFTDNIYSLTERHYPAWAPLGPRLASERIRLERETCAGARVVFSASDFLRDALIGDYGCDSERVITVGLGCNTARESLSGKRWDSRIALFVGTDFRRKGGATLLEAWRLVRQRLPDAKLQIVGPKSRPPVAARVPGVVWIGHIDDRYELERLYDQAQVFVLPSLFEPFGRSVFEAMGHGLPCVVTDGGGIRESVEPGKDGLLVPAGDPESLAEALVGLLDDADGSSRMGSCGYQKVQTRFTWDDVVDRMAPGIVGSRRLS